MHIIATISAILKNHPIKIILFIILFFWFIFPPILHFTGGYKILDAIFYPAPSETSLDLEGVAIVSVKPRYETIEVDQYGNEAKGDYYDTYTYTLFGPKEAGCTKYCKNTFTTYDIPITFNKDAPFPVILSDGSVVYAEIKDLDEGFTDSMTFSRWYPLTNTTSTIIQRPYVNLITLNQMLEKQEYVFNPSDFINFIGFIGNVPLRSFITEGNEGVSYVDIIPSSAILLSADGRAAVGGGSIGKNLLSIARGEVERSHIDDSGYSGTNLSLYGFQELLEPTTILYTENFEKPIFLYCGYDLDTIGIGSGILSPGGIMSYCYGLKGKTLVMRDIATKKERNLVTIGSFDIKWFGESKNNFQSVSFYYPSSPRKDATPENPYINYSYDLSLKKRELGFRNTVSPEYDLAHFVIGDLGNYLIDTNTNQTAKLPYDSSYEILSVRRVNK